VIHGQSVRLDAKSLGAHTVLGSGLLLCNYNNSVRTSQEMHYVSTTEICRIMVFGESLFTVRIIWKTQIHSVGRMQSVTDSNHRALKV
jgi:hypothetical protein